MKFLCDQCKAKYQIADDKVAGKTVRMKCRKCGHMIEVRAAVTETSVSIDFSAEENPAAALPQAQAPRPQQPPPRPQAPKPTGGALATSFSAARPAPRPPSASRPDTGGLASAFNRTVQKEDDLELLELHAADEWYVAINGVPVGPVRMGELRRKAATGAVTEDSLVWQEGLEEWRPVRAISDLAGVVREAMANGRVSLATPPPPEARSSAPPGPPTRTAPTRPPGHAQHPHPHPPAAAASPFAAPRPPAHPAHPAHPATTPAPPAAARSNVVPFTARGSASGLATAERLEEAPVSALLSPRPVPPAVVPDPFAVPPGPAMSATSAMAFGPAIAAPAPSLVPPAPQKAPPWIAIAMVVLAGAFGITAAIILLTRPAQQAQPVVAQLPSAPTPAPTTPPPSDDLPPPDTTPATPGSAATGKPAVAMHPGGGSRPTPPGGGNPSPAPTNSAIAALLGNGSGPTPGGPSPGGGGGGGSQLTSDQIEATVRGHQAGVKRSCFEKIATDKTGTVQVTVTAVVGASGAVQSATANGNDPMISKCIEGSVRSWQFPASGGTTTVNIPFKFVRQ